MIGHCFFYLVGCIIQGTDEYDTIDKDTVIPTIVDATLYDTDADGNIAYFHGNFIPRRDTRFNFNEPVDGSDPATDWQGLHTVDEEITLLNPPNGWIQNCNSTPYTAALEFSPQRGAFPSYMSADEENFRGIHAIGLLQGRSPWPTTRTCLPLKCLSRGWYRLTMPLAQAIRNWAPPSRC